MLDSLHLPLFVVHPILDRLGDTADLSADMNIEVDQFALTVRAEDHSLIITMKRLYDARLLVKKVLSPLLGNSAKIEIFEKVIERMNKTVYVHNRYLGIIGPRANPILIWALRRFVAHAA